jgi:hypothetical protein
MNSKKDIDQLIRFLEKEEISAETALKILVKSVSVNPSNHRSRWKMMRFTLYIWERHKEYKLNMLGKKIDTIRRVVDNPKYERLWKTHHQPGPFNKDKEIKNLNLLVTDPRQFPIFKSRNFNIENTKTPIPQELLNKIR